jgi:multidrug resistance efflux pump
MQDMKREASGMTEEKAAGQNQQDVKKKGNQEIMGEEKKSRSKKKLLLPVLMVVVLAACSAAYYYFSQESHYFTTDNAKVTAKMYTVTPNMAGELQEWRVQEGQKVAKDQVLGRQAALPYIVAPISGTIVKNNAIEGQMVSVATQLAVVADTDHMYIGVNIEETDIMKIKVGQKAEVTIDAYAGKTFAGTVTEIDQTTQTYFSSTSSFSTSGTYTKVTQLIPVKVVIANEENLPLTFGMNATVKIHLKDQGTDTDGQSQAPGAEAAITASSSVEAGREINVRPDVSGKVQAVKVEIGQSVKEGDVLFVLDSTELALQLQQAQASSNAALSSYRNAKATYDSQANIVPLQKAHEEAVAAFERMKVLYEAQAVSKVDFDNAKDRVDTSLAQLEAAKASAKTALDAAAAQMESAQAALAILQEKVSNCEVKAPMAGLVASKSIKEGDMATSQAAAVTLIDLQNVILPIDVSETNISRIKAGDEAEITVQSIGALIKGKVARVAPACNPATGMFRVEIEAENPEGILKAGMAADVKLP